MALALRLARIGRHTRRWAYNVSEHRERAYNANPCKDWIKVKNPKSTANGPRQGRRLVTRIALLFLVALSLTSCANAPHWLGGLPTDAPPRPGTPEYDTWMAQRAQEAARPKTGQQQPHK